MTTTLRHGEFSAVIDDVGFGLQVVEMRRGERVVCMTPAPMWRLTLRRDARSGTLSRVDSADPHSSQGRVEEVEGGVDIRWDVTSPADGSPFQVLVRLRVGPDGLDHRIVVDFGSPGWALWDVRFPITIVARVADAEVMLLPWQEGGVVLDPANEMTREKAIGVNQRRGLIQRNPSFHSTFQMAAWYGQDETMLYLETRDPEFHLKRFLFEGVGYGTRIEAVRPRGAGLPAVGPLEGVVRGSRRDRGGRAQRRECACSTTRDVVPRTDPRRSAKARRISDPQTRHCFQLMRSPDWGSSWARRMARSAILSTTHSKWASVSELRSKSGAVLVKSIA